MDDTSQHSDPLIAFSAIDWSSPQRGMRVKQVQRNGQLIRLIELDKSFTEADWCRTGHVGYVIEGTLKVEFSDRSIQFQAGDALWVPPGDSTQHKAKALGGPTLLFVIDQPRS